MKDIMAIAVRKDSMKILCEIPFKDRDLTKLDVSRKNLGMEGALVLSDFLHNNWALSSLHVGMNSIPEKEMKEIITIALKKDSMKILCEVPIKDKTLTALDISSKNLGMEGALAVAEYLRGNSALTSLHVGLNSIPVKEMNEITTIAMAKDSMKILCEVPIKDKALTELDISRKNPSVEGALVLAEYLRNNGTISTAIIHTFPLPIQEIKTKAELDLSGKELGVLDVVVLAALLPLNVSGTICGYHCYHCYH
jgi:hypothetical protein